MGISGEQATILKVVLVSPGDVAKERALAAGVVEELNRHLAPAFGCRFELWRWETDSYPGMHLEGPQGHIDGQMKIEQAAVVVGVFWKRFGTPTHDANSGTEHELRKAWASWRDNGFPQVMVYFSKKPYSHKSAEELAQQSRVLQFQEEMSNEQMFFPYKSPAEFEKLLRRHLTAWLVDKKDELGAGQASPAPTLTRIADLLDEINPEIQRQIANTGFAVVVANSEEFAALRKLVQSSEACRVEILPNTIFGYQAGYSLGIYTLNDNGAGKIHFRIIRVAHD